MAYVLIVNLNEFVKQCFEGCRIQQRWEENENCSP